VRAALEAGLLQAAEACRAAAVLPMSPAEQPAQWGRLAVQSPVAHALRISGSPSAAEFQRDG